ncbi:MAG: SMI1/KNR4 family protein [Myxococcales bacterium]|nr:SMI1/KNR4 family protein [Myxococcales bacterium]
MISPILTAQIAALLAERDREFDPPPFDPAVAEVLGPSGAPQTPHRRLLEQANGAWLFAGALHLFGACEGPPWHGLRAWNAPATWRDAYARLTDGLVFFAEDAFGDQYGYSGRGGEVVRFDAELGRREQVADSFGHWLDAVLTHPEAMLPLDVVAAQAALGKRLRPGNQLFAYPPLFSVEAAEGVDLGHVDAIEAMRFRGALAVQLQGLPPGTQVKIDLE